MVLKILFLLLFYCTLGKTELCSKCRQGKTFGLKSADCYRKDLKEIPQCLKSDVEVLELSYNRLRKITTEELSRYNNVKILYLSENMITIIEEKALEDKSYLETLDISVNSFSKIPGTVIFRLPSLKKLYMSQNHNMNVAHEIESSKPITSPLTYLDISFNELLTELPNLGIISTLLYYNITGNKNVKMNTSNFAGICKLKALYNTNTTPSFDDPCDCWNLQSWLEDRNIQFDSFNCQPQDCNIEISPEDLQIFDECNKMHEGIVHKAKMFKIVLPVSIIIAALVLALLIVFIYKNRKQQERRRLENTKNKIASQQGLLD